MRERFLIVHYRMVSLKLHLKFVHDHEKFDDGIFDAMCTWALSGTLLIVLVFISGSTR